MAEPVLLRFTQMYGNNPLDPLFFNQPTRATIVPTHQPQPKVSFKNDPIKAAQHICATLFPRSRAPTPYMMMVYLFTMPHHFLLLLSPRVLPFTPFTHSGDGLYQVNPIYTRPIFTYAVSQEFHTLLSNQQTGLHGVPPLVTFKGSWNGLTFPQDYCTGTLPKLITRESSVLHTPYFSMRLIEDSWESTDTLQGVAYSLGTKAFRVWFHEKNPQALVNAIGDKKDELKKLQKLEGFLKLLPQFDQEWNQDLFKSQEDINRLGEWRQFVINLVDGHPDKLRPEIDRRSTEIQSLISEFKGKQKEIKKAKKKPAEKAVKEGELEEIRKKLVNSLREFLDESFQWVDSSPLSLSPKFLQGIEGAVQCAQRELADLQACDPLLAQPDQERGLEQRRCPTSAYRSTMQIESTTENPTSRQRGWVYLPTCIELIDWYLRPLSDAPHQDAPPVPVRFFEEAIGFLQKKEIWIRNHGFSSQLEPDRFLNLVRYHTHTLSDFHSRFNELRRFFTNCHVPQHAADSYPLLFEEIFYLEQLVKELKQAFDAVSPDYTFQFYQETRVLAAKRGSILTGVRIYKRMNAGGNIEYEFLEVGMRSRLNIQNQVHTRVYA